jgi:uracil-DNA glycosylase
MPIPEDKETLKRHAHENIYYTNLYKFASKEQGDIPDWAIQTGLATDLIDEEIGSVQPSAIVVFGSPAWKRCFRKRAIPTDYAAERLNKSPADTNITEVAGLPFHDDSLDSVIIPLTHITSRISDAERETNWQKVQHT